MALAIAPEDDRIAPIGWFLICVRLPLMLLLLIVCVPFHYLWRLVGLDRLWPRIFLSGVGIIAGVRLTRHGKRIPGALLLSNHVSWLDILALARAANSAFVAHDGLTGHPFLKWLCQMNETVFVARHRRGSVAKQAEDIRAAMDHGGTLTLFPEGTTNNGKALLPFKSSLLGALEPLPEGAMVQPVALAYRGAADIAWFDAEPGLTNFKRILARVRPIRLDVHFLPPLEGSALDNRKNMTAAAQERIARTLDLHVGIA